MVDFTLIIDVSEDFVDIASLRRRNVTEGQKAKKQKGNFISWNQTLKDRNEFCTVSVSMCFQ